MWLGWMLAAGIWMLVAPSVTAHGGRGMGSHHGHHGGWYYGCGRRYSFGFIYYYAPPVYYYAPPVYYYVPPPYSVPGPLYYYSGGVMYRY